MMEFDVQSNADSTLIVHDETSVPALGLVSALPDAALAFLRLEACAG